ncbi:sugar transferase [Arthrobacter sp. Br18]|uniref:sugar transferase n=1 Tax=Arthrobacter sp. Br18 TaxID=1312954 RepID=UPI0004BBA938|nr:sugar transferase [Arthrobacter sp. Br18]
MTQIYSSLSALQAQLLPTSVAAVPVLSGVAWRKRYQRALRFTDTAIILSAMLVSVTVLAQGRPDVILQNRELLGVGIAATAVWLLMMNLLRTRDSRVVGTGSGEYMRVIRASAATFAIFAVVVVILNLHDLRGILFVALPVGLFVLLGSRWLWRQWLIRQSRFGHFLSKVVVVGRPGDVQYVTGQLALKSGAAFDVVGAVYEGRVSSAAVQVAGRLVPAVSGLHKVEDFVQLTGADAVIVAGHLREGRAYIRELGWRLEKTSTELVLASALTNVAGPRITMRPVEGLPLMHVELPQFAGGRHVVKRALDIAVSLTAIIALAPLCVVLAIIIRLDSPGGAIFVQERAGRQSTLFRMFKFRSMVLDAEKELNLLKQQNQGSGPLFKMRHDPRVTSVGRFIRKYSLDELPQLYNVLRGDMSLVGPRPPLLSEVSDYEHHTHRRLLIKPGLTGLWQVSGRSNLDWEESVRLDLYYVENWSVTGDLMIMWRTFKVMLKPVGAY